MDAGQTRTEQPPAAGSALETEAQRWLRETRPAVEAWNEFVERNGIPFSEYRQF